MKLYTITILIAVLVTGCISRAKLSAFDQSANTIDFEKLSKEFKQTTTPFLTYKTTNEYYFEIAKNIEETKIIEVIKMSLSKYKYKLAFSNVENKCIIGKRGIKANEWKSITAVYYKTSIDKIQIYLNTKISQDFTGGIRQNRAMEVGKLIEQILKNNK